MMRYSLLSNISPSLVTSPPLFFFCLRKYICIWKYQNKIQGPLAANWLSFLSLLFLSFQKNDGLRSAGLLPAQHTVHQHVSQHQVWHLNQQHQVPSGRQRSHHAHVLSEWVEGRQLLHGCGPACGIVIQVEVNGRRKCRFCRFKLN